MTEFNITHPLLRPVEAFPIEHEGEQMVLLQDPAGLASSPLVVSPAGFFVAMHFDGQHSLDQVQDAFETHFGQELPREQLEQMLQQIDLAYYLDSQRFRDFYQAQVDAYRAAAARPSRDVETFGVQEGESLPALLDRMLGDRSPDDGAIDGRRLVGMVAPHLDYPRGTPCYAAAYRRLAAAGPVERVVILGTNHFGQGTSIVATDKDFETPLGLARTDRAFLAELQKRCGADLRAHDFDHLREHSVELQVNVLQHLLGAGKFEIVPLLCPDPSGPNGIACDGLGPDLRVFAELLGTMIAESDRPTLILAGADLSHIGSRFGDRCDLDESFLAEVERKDREAIGALIVKRPDLFVETIAGRQNDTRICSAGSIYTLATALPHARPELLGYHQAVDKESGTGVSCMAMAFWE